MAGQTDEIVYREVQRWSLGARSLLLTLCLLAAAGGLVSAVITPTQGDHQWVFLLVVGLCGILVPLGVGLVIWIARLDTEVRRDGLYIRYVPFHRNFRRFKAEDLRESYTRPHRPILEYGGWGIRYGWKGKAHNVRGNQGVQLVLRDGRRVLIGSARPAELEAALRSIAHGS
jgi:hypothetical protein